MLGSGLAGLSLGLGPTPLWHAVLSRRPAPCAFLGLTRKSPPRQGYAGKIVSVVYFLLASSKLTFSLRFNLISFSFYLI